MLRSELTFDEYAAWCLSRFPELPGDDVVEVYAATEPPTSNDTCPVTVRSRESRAIITPRGR